MGSPNIVQGSSYHVYRNATHIAVNWQKNILLHPNWGEIFLFQNDYMNN